ncbi:hypothetical protein L1049_015905 [Liquidambar formosana]|uniref:Uncharacterized protein n=1 Tax=Liquidambar formosana TaxID=63359 RepID=A0AAP0X045_LIQFO
MATIGLVKTKMLLLRETKRIERRMSKLASINHQQGKSKRSTDDDKRDQNQRPFWVPHPRTGIYFPKGHDWVMDDVPDGAASFDQTHWLRNVDGVDKPDPDTVPDQYPL